MDLFSCVYCKAIAKISQEKGSETQMEGIRFEPFGFIEVRDES